MCAGTPPDAVSLKGYGDSCLLIQATHNRFSQLRFPFPRSAPSQADTPDFRCSPLFQKKKNNDALNKWLMLREY